MGTPTRSYSLLVARAPLQGAHSYLVCAGGIRYVQTPRLTSGDAFSVFSAIRMVRVTLAKVCESESVRTNKAVVCSRNMFFEVIRL